MLKDSSNFCSFLIRLRNKTVHKTPEGNWRPKSTRARNEEKLKISIQKRWSSRYGCVEVYDIRGEYLHLEDVHRRKWSLSTSSSNHLQNSICWRTNLRTIRAIKEAAEERAETRAELIDPRAVGGWAWSPTDRGPPRSVDRPGRIEGASSAEILESPTMSSPSAITSWRDRGQGARREGYQRTAV